MFKSRYSLIYASSLLFGLLAAVAMNDTVALPELHILQEVKGG
jgi:hypothetical protein